MRIDRVVAQLKKELTLIIIRDLKDPRLGMITITQVLLTPDLKEATVFFSSLGDKKQGLATLEHAKGFLRSQLAQRMRLKFVPDLHFKIDDGPEYAERINRLFNELHQDPET